MSFVSSVVEGFGVGVGVGCGSATPCLRGTNVKFLRFLRKFSPLLVRLLIFNFGNSGTYGNSGNPV